MKQVGIVRLYDSFLSLLYNNRHRIAFLQFTGMIEDYLTKEFAYHIYIKSKSTLFPYINYSAKQGRRFDIVIFGGGYPTEKRKIYGLIEAKHLCNKHRDTNNRAIDNIKPSLSSLEKQISMKNVKAYLKNDLALRSRTTNLYGIVFASFKSDVRNDAQNDKEKREFYRDICSKADKFRYHDYENSYLHSVYDDIKVNVLGKDKFASLKVGLWRIK